MKTVLCLVLSAVVACTVAFPQQRTVDGTTESSGKLFDPTMIYNVTLLLWLN